MGSGTQSMGGIRFLGTESSGACATQQWHGGRSDDNVACADAFGVMVSRISGIVGGTLISLLVAITIYPSSATQELLEDVKEALRGLCELDNAAIQEAAIALGHVSRPDDGECVAPLSWTLP